MLETCRFPCEVSWKTFVATYDVDESCSLKLSSQMKMQQEVGEIHLEQCGLPYIELCKRGIIFVLTRSHGIIYRTPKLEEKLCITTWERECKGVQFFRCYRFEDENGELCIDSCSSFAMIDPINHKLLRPKVLKEICNLENKEKETTCPTANKIVIPDNMKQTNTRIIRYSDIDYNGHLNNTVYADLLCDYVPGGMKKRQIREFGIQYVNEAHQEEVLNIYTAEKNGIYYMYGDHNRGRCFDGYIRFV